MPDESVRIHMMGGGTFVALIGDGTLDPAARCAAVYDLVEADQPLYGRWCDFRGAAHRPVCLHIAGRHAIRDVEAAQ